MNRTIPVRDDVIYLGNDVTVDSAVSPPVQDVPPLEIVDLDTQIIGLDTQVSNASDLNPLGFPE